MLAQLEVLKAENERLRQELEAIKTQVGSMTVPANQHIGGGFPP